MNKRDNQQAQEVSNLKLELATFALRLDVFVARMYQPFALGENDPAFTVLQYRFSGLDFG
jgi:hypothetical protein